MDGYSKKEKTVKSKMENNIKITKNIDDIRKKLLNILDEKSVLFNESMADHTSFRAGGKAAVLVLPNSKAELIDVLKIVICGDVPYMVMGNGSNILVKDEGFNGIIIKTSKALSEVKVDGDVVYAGSGALLGVVAKAALENSLTGMEFASGIPGTIGGAAFMNAGAYDGEMKDIIQDVELFDIKNGKIYKAGVDEMDYGYRYSILYAKNDVVLGINMKLSHGNPDEIKAKMDELMQRRNSKQPVNYPSAGSFFKRPEGYFAGKLIEDAGLKGFRVGDAQVSMLHAGFVINLGKATATDIINLMHVVQARVMSEFGVKLEPEIRIIGDR